MLGQKDFAVASLLASLSFPNIGNLYEAVKAIVDNPEAVTCTLDTELADEYHDSCQQKDNIVRFRAGKVFTLRQDWGGSSSTGAAVWNGANMAGWLMENKIGRDGMKGKNVIELGAGVGFGGLVANALGAENVVITDGNVDVLKLADVNIDINCPDKSKIRTAQLRWNTDDEKPFLDKKWDYIFAADVTYLKKNRHDLMSTIYKLSGPLTVTYLSMEPRNVDEMEDISAEIAALGLSMQEETLPYFAASKDQCNLLCPRMLAIRKSL